MQREYVFPASELPEFLAKAKPIIEQCLEVIEKSGISAADAEAIPDELLTAIKNHNKQMKAATPFKRASMG